MVNELKIKIKNVTVELEWVAYVPSYILELTEKS